MLSEFDIIRICFEQQGLAGVPNDIVIQGIGDDCAVIAVPPGKELAFSMDTLVEKVHFPVGAEAANIGTRSLAVNLSDLAAMGAEPCVFTLGLTLPEADKTWLCAFASGLKSVAAEYNCYLVGGDITRGPLTVTVQVHGLVEQGRAITRSGASPGDRIYVTGSLGVAAYALRVMKEKTEMSSENRAHLDTAFYRPLPRISIGVNAAGIVSAGIDISDGLLADLGHLCRCSNTGAEISVSKVPISKPLVRDLPEQEAQNLALTGGDDYELLLTAEPDNEKALLALGDQHNVPIHCIGIITEGSNISCIDGEGREVTFEKTGYSHFS